MKRVICFAGAALLLTGCGHSKTGKPPAEAVPVKVAQATRQDVPVEVIAIGYGEPLATVTLRPQIEGQVEKVLFNEGQFVQTGDPLLELDKRPFEAALRLAEANLKKDQAMLSDSQSELRRMNELREHDFAATREQEQTQANSEARAAQVQADQAEIDMARLRLEYCTIRAPFAGRTGVRLVERGKAVKANETDMVVLNQMSPIYVRFAVPEQHLTQIREQMAKGPLEVRATLSGEAGPPEVGKLTFVDNQVDASTGQIKLKASFTNERGRIWPGRFMNVALVVDHRAGAVVVPTQAVQAGQNGSFLYVVTADGSAATRPVQIEPGPASHLIVKGQVKEGDTVVVDGQSRLAPGAKVRVIDEPAKVAPKTT